MLEPIDQLLDGIKKLDQNNPDDAQKYFLNCSRLSAKRLELLTSDVGGKEILFNYSCVMEAAAWYYLTYASKSLKQNDNLAYLGYLCYASGIMAVLDTVIVPMLQANAKNFAQEEASLLLRIAKNLSDRTKKSINDAMNRLTEDDAKRLRQRVEETFRMVINAVDPLAEEVREKSVKLATRFAAGDFKQARKIFEFVRDEILYVYDPFGFEKVQTPVETLRLGCGDCDDKAVLLASLLSAVGFETAIIFADTNRDHVADHTYCAVYIEDAPDFCKFFPHKELPDKKDLHNWIPLDPTFEDSEFGMIPVADLEIIKFIPTTLRITN